MSEQFSNHDSDYKKGFSTVSSSDDVISYIVRHAPKTYRRIDYDFKEKNCFRKKLDGQCVSENIPCKLIHTSWPCVNQSVPVFFSDVIFSSIRVLLQLARVNWVTV